jgi:nucleotidyltransferase-like protein
MTVRRLSVVAVMALALGSAVACGRRPAAPVSLVLLDIVPVENRAYTEWAGGALEAFTRETGIAVERQRPPQFTDEQLALQRRILEGRGTTPEVYVVDAISPGTLAEHLLALSSHFERERSGHFPELVANNVVGGAVVGAPCDTRLDTRVWRDCGRVHDGAPFVEGNHYFPAESLHKELLRDSSTHTTCAWKGVASYYDVVVDG